MSDFSPRLNRAHRATLSAMKLQRGCADYGYREDADALEWDHVRGVKGFRMALAPGRSWKRIWAEIAKCEVVCANCHRKRTRDRRLAAA